MNEVAFPTSEGQQLRDFCYVSDIVCAILMALNVKNVEGEVFNIASGEPVTIRSMIDEVCGIVGMGDPQYGEIPYRPEENMALYADISKAKKVLGWNPDVSLSEGLKKTIQWMKNANV